MLRNTILFLLFLSFTLQIVSQEKRNRKKITTTRITQPPKIDGLLDDAVWKNAELMHHFIMFKPDNGKPEADTHKTIVKLIYDDNAIYISASMFDDNPSSIPKEVTNRDNIGNSDFFLITINPNDDGQNPFEFLVTSSGTQADAKISGGKEDFSWSAVWKSAVTITDKGWFVEMKIPYSALRFSNQAVQSWGINFFRDIKSLNAKFTWNYIDNKKGTWTQYDGLVEGFKNIKPPIRLSFYPYASATNTSYNGTSTFNYSAGLDLKYGITENFTLDATLIPDFGQTRFDDATLNLGPFEQQFSERRPFFTEGTELFGKGDLFYSRRIGDRASVSERYLSSTLAANEEITNYPEKVQLLNAIKISGRTKKGLGIGLFNAFTEKTSASIKNTTTQQVRTETVEPFTNYNILVLDQQFNQNSAITLINTNVTRKGKFRDGNVTGLLYHVETKDSKYNIDGSVRMSNVGTNGAKSTGYSFDTSIGKGFGNWQGEIGYNFDDDKFDINDMGFQFNNNTQTIYGNLSYRILKPTKKFNSIILNTYFQRDYLYKPKLYTGNNVGLHTYLQTKKRFSFGGGININLGDSKDFYEPRQGTVSGIYYSKPARAGFYHFGNTDSRKKLYLKYNFSGNSYKNNPKNNYGFGVTTRYRFNKQFSLSYGFRYNKTNKDRGFVKQTANNIIFGQRDRTPISNTISSKFNFSTKSSLSLTFRHYWETVKYDGNYFNLGANGVLTPNNTYTRNNVNYNSWNIDLNYIWEFAPGSQLIAFYRNAIFNSDNNANLNFFSNIDNLFNQPKEHLFSLRLVYYIDYNRLFK